MSRQTTSFLDLFLEGKRVFEIQENNNEGNVPTLGRLAYDSIVNRTHSLKNACNIETMTDLLFAITLSFDEEALRILEFYDKDNQNDIESINKFLTHGDDAIFHAIMTPNFPKGYRVKSEGELNLELIATLLYKGSTDACGALEDLSLELRTSIMDTVAFQLELDLELSGEM